ncbi:hypothetical protein N8878_06485, partial [Psychromonas sp.]|nr:hypothetical protein [Psychromonas sp.]
MKYIYRTIAITGLLTTISACQTTQQPEVALNFKEGETLQALVNVHGDMSRGKFYALNYQLPSMIPICDEIVVNSIDEDVINISYKETKYNYLWDGHTKKAGQSLAENFDLYFGKQCDKAAVEKLSVNDKKGIEQGIAKIGMSKQGVKFAMGYPPLHATPSMESDTWIYWRNRWGKRAIEFSNDG